jgi:hypothetical protein
MINIYIISISLSMGEWREIYIFTRSPRQWTETSVQFLQIIKFTSK